MNKTIRVISLCFLALYSIITYAGDRDFFNTTNNTLEIQLNGLRCDDYPTRFTHCQVETENTTVAILKPNHSVHATFNHYFLGKITVINVSTGEKLDQQILVDKKGNPIFNELNYCAAVILKSIDYDQFIYEFDGCLPVAPLPT